MSKSSKPLLAVAAIGLQTGDVTSDFTWKPWKDMDDTSLVRRIERDCIMFER